MIRINLLRSRKGARTAGRRFPFKAVLSVLLFAAVMFIGYSVYKSVRRPSPAVYEENKRVVALKKVETPFDVVENIVDDIHGGRFKVRSLNRLSSPIHLSPNEKKLYERLFIKTTFDALNGAIRPGMGFNTLSLDNEGNFFVYGVTGGMEAANEFKLELEKSDCILKVDELAFERKLGESRTHFALKGFLNYNILERFYEDDSWSRDEIFKDSPENVLYDIRNLGRERGLVWKHNPEWGESEPYGAYQRHILRMQVESTYSGLMKWINDLYELNMQIGFCKLNLTSVGSGRILSAIECTLYAKN